jgi:hypothetical protein
MSWRNQHSSCVMLRLRLPVQDNWHDLLFGNVLKMNSQKSLFHEGLLSRSTLENSGDSDHHIYTHVFLCFRLRMTIFYLFLVLCSLIRCNWLFLIGIVYLITHMSNSLASQGH